MWAALFYAFLRVHALGLGSIRFMSQPSTL